jgi:hypothetical protein
MAEAFDPSKFLSETSPSQGGQQGFDPNKFLEETKPWYSMTGKGMVKSTVDALPMAFAVGGGALGAGLGLGVGAIPAAGAGAMVGQGIKSLANRYGIGGEPETRPEYYKNMAMAFPNGMAQEAGGQALGKTGEAFSQMGAPESANAPAIQAAAKKLGVTPTKGMLTNDYMTRNLENSLSQSPTLAGGLIRREQAPVYEAQANAASKATADANGQTPDAAGANIKKTLMDYVDARNAPIKQAYKEIETHIQNIPVDEASRARISNNIGNIDAARFSGSPGAKVAQQFQGWLNEPGANSVDGIKELRTKAQQIASNHMADPDARRAASDIYDRLDRLLTNSSVRGAINVARGAQPAYGPNGRFISGAAQEEGAQAEGMAIGKKLVGDIKTTGKQYGSMMNDLNTIGKNSGLSKPKIGKGPEGFKYDIGDKTNESIAPALFDTENLQGLKHLQDKVPEAFEIARQQKLNDIVDRSTGRDGSVDPVKLQKTISSINPEVQDMLFGRENVDNLDAARTLQRATPAKVGGSDTPRGLQFRDAMSPLTAPIQNAADIARYGLLKLKPLATPIGKAVQKYSSGSGLIRGGG